MFDEEDSGELDLDKIAEFMNSAPKAEDVNTNELENTLDYIDTQLEEVKKGTKTVATKEDIEKQEITIDDLAKLSLEQLSKVTDHSEEIFNLFYTPIALRQDRSDASKQALVESQRLRIECINALASLANAKAKLEMAKQKVAPQVGIAFGAMGQQEAGINLHNLWQNSENV